MAWIAFASVPVMLVVMLAMGQLEARLLPRNPPPKGDHGGVRPDAGLYWEIPYWEIPAAPFAGGTPVERREEAGT